MPVILLQTCMVWVAFVAGCIFSFIILEQVFCLLFCFPICAGQLSMILLLLSFAFSSVFLTFMVEFLYCSSSVLSENMIVLSGNQIQFTLFLFMRKTWIGIRLDVVRCFKGVFESGVRRCLVFFFCWWSRGTIYYTVFIWLIWAMNCILCNFGSLYIRAFPWVVFLCKNQRNQFLEINKCFLNFVLDWNSIP